MKSSPVLLRENDLTTQSGLSARAVHERLVKLAKAHRRLESALSFYLLEVETRALFLQYGHSSTVDYAREELGLEDVKTRTLLRLAIRLEELPKMKAAFGRGEIPYTKAREAVKAATPETEEAWIQKCKELTNRQLEHEVKKEVPPEQRRFVSFLLDEDRIAVWGRVREAMERMAGKTLTEIEIWDLMCAVAMLEHDLTPPLGDESAPMTGYVREVIERDGFRCTRPGCGNRSALQGSHIVPRARRGSDNPSNLHTACAVCHQAIERGILKVSGTAPDNITWEGPFGIIETPQLKSQTRGAVPDRVGEAPVSYGGESTERCNEAGMSHVVRAVGSSVTAVPCSLASSGVPDAGARNVLVGRLGKNEEASGASHGRRSRSPGLVAEPRKKPRGQRRRAIRGTEARFLRPHFDDAPPHLDNPSEPDDITREGPVGLSDHRNAPADYTGPEPAAVGEAPEGLRRCQPRLEQSRRVPRGTRRGGLREGLKESHLTWDRTDPRPQASGDSMHGKSCTAWDGPGA